VNDLIAVWLAGLPMHEMRAFNDLALSLAFAKQKAESLPPSIDRRCAALINTRLDEAEHWALAAMRAAVDRADREEWVEGGPDGPAPGHDIPPIEPEDDG
jgi:hypothetical protein